MHCLEHLTVLPIVSFRKSMVPFYNLYKQFDLLLINIIDPSHAHSFIEINYSHIIICIYIS